MPAAPPDPTSLFATLKGRRHVALAVSGGSDSMAMLRLAANWRSARPAPPAVSVLTVDHGLRPESARETSVVADWTAALGLPHHALAWTGPKPSTGLQARARKARYGLMADWCRAQGAEMLLTAHTLDDQAETVLMRLARTTSPDSLAGIARDGTWEGLPLLRPLLDLRRDALKDYLRALPQPWIEDPSNADPRFERVRVRTGLVAPKAPDAIRLATLAREAARTVELLDRCARRWLALWLEEHDAGLCFAPTAGLLALPAPLQQRILGLLVRHYGGGGFNPEREELSRLARWLAKEGAVRRTLGGAVLGKRKDRFWVTREAARIDPAPVTVGAGKPLIWDGRFAIAAPEGARVAPAGGGPVGLPDGIPVHARRAYPKVELPPGTGPAHVTFLRILSS